MRLFTKMKTYPVTTSLMFFNVYTYWRQDIEGLKKAKKRFVIEKWETYIKRDERPQLKDFIKNFTHFNCSLSKFSLGVNLATLLIIGRNLEILYGSRLMIVIELSNYLLHIISYYFSRMSQLDLFFIKKQSEDFSIALTLALMSHSIPINLNYIMKILLFLASFGAIFTFNLDNYIFSAIISSFLITYYCRYSYKVI